MTHARRFYADENLRQPFGDGFRLDRYAQFARHIPAGSTTVLDVGCGEGAGGAVLAATLPDVQLLGLDCVPQRLELAPADYSETILGLSTAIPLEDQTMDVVVAGEFLEHLRPHDVDQTLCEFQRVLRIGGRLLLTTPNPASLGMRLRGGSVYSVAHLTQHDPAVLRLRLQMHGFSRVRVRGSGRMSRYVGERFPLRSAYGSYLMSGDKV